MRCFLSLLALTSLAGCQPEEATDPDAGVDAASDAGASVVTPALPYYEVPVDGALVEHAYFAVPDVHYVTTGDTVTLSYDFPADLSGVLDQEVVFTGPVDALGNATLSGPTGVGTCEATGDVVRCTEMFSAGLAIDLPAATAMASGYSSDAAVREARVQVLERFASDPIGIVIFDRRIASEPSGGDD